MGCVFLKPKLVSNRSYFENREMHRETDEFNLKENKELEIDKIFGV